MRVRQPVQPIAAIVVVLSLLFVLSAGIGAAQSLRATTEDGKPVTLSPDGTWKYTSVQPAVATKPNQARRLIRGARVAYGIWIDESKWRVGKKQNDENTERDYFLSHVNGDGYAMVIAERISVPVAALKTFAINRAKQASPDARLVREEKRTVNGVEVLALQIEVTIQEIPFVYYGYYYSGKQGSVQVVTYTGRNLFNEYAGDFADLLNGFVVD